MNFNSHLIQILVMTEKENTKAGIIIERNQSSREIKHL